MTHYITTPTAVKNPGWTKRNITISKHIPDGTKVLDLGCGAKDLTRYIKPSVYVGVDYLEGHADVTRDFNLPFLLPTMEWDFVVISGLIEYLHDLDMFFDCVKHHGKTYIISIWNNFDTINNPNQLSSVDEYIQCIKRHFWITNEDYWKLHRIFICRDKE